MGKLQYTYALHTVDGWTPAPPGDVENHVKYWDTLPTSTGERRISEPSTVSLIYSLHHGEPSFRYQWASESPINIPLPGPLLAQGFASHPKIYSKKVHVVFNDYLILHFFWQFFFQGLLYISHFSVGFQRWFHGSLDKGAHIGQTNKSLNESRPSSHHQTFQVPKMEESSPI